MFSENIKLENKPLYAKNAKMEEKGYLYDVIFLNCGHLNQNENYQKNITYISVKRKQRITNSKMMMFLLGGHFRPILYIILSISYFTSSIS